MVPRPRAEDATAGRSPTARHAPSHKHPLADATERPLAPASLPLKFHASPRRGFPPPPCSPQSTIPPFIALRPLQESRKFSPTPTGHSNNPHAAVPHPARPSRNGPVYRGGPFPLPEGDRACATSSPPALPHHGQLARTFHLCPSVPHLWLPLPLPLVSAFLIGVYLCPFVASDSAPHRPIPSPFPHSFGNQQSAFGNRPFRVISGSKRGRFGVVVGSFWGHFGVTSGSVWGRFFIILLSRLKP